MNHTQIVELFDRCAATGSHKQKLAYVQEALKQDTNGLLRKVFIYATDPMYVFYIGKPPSVTTASKGKPFGDEAFALLDALRKRELTGNAARDAIQKHLDELDGEGQILLQRILLKDLRCAVTSTIVNKAVPGLVYEFDLMLAEQYEPEKIVFPAVVEPKFDGMRVVSFEDANGNSGWRHLTRTGKDVTTMPESAAIELTRLANLVREQTGVDEPLMVDGELMGSSFKDTMSKARKKSQKFEDGKYYTFDVLPARAFKNLAREPSSWTYQYRRSLLEGAFEAFRTRVTLPINHLVLPRSYAVSSHAEIQDFYKAVRRINPDTGKPMYEGLIVKNLNGLYRASRHIDWMKVKAVETMELSVIDVEEGKNKNAGSLGALICDHNGVRVKVGGGFKPDKKMRDGIWNDWHNPDQAAVPIRGRLCEVEFQEVTEAGSLRHGRFIRWRDDKPADLSEGTWS